MSFLLTLVLILSSTVLNNPPTSPVVLPPVNGVFDYQLGGIYDVIATPDGPVQIDVVARDVTSAPLPGAYNICYINGFQTQPGDAAFWLTHPDLLLRNQHGDPVTDPSWPDEYILDPSTAVQREGILAIIGPLVAHCADAGFDAVDIDNIDSWSRFPQIDKEGARELLLAYIKLVH